MRLQLKKTQVFIVISILYAAVQFVLLYYVKNSAVFCAGVIPIILISWLQGYRATVVMGTVMIVIQPIFFHLTLKPITIVDFFAGSLATVVMVSVGVIFGRMAELTKMVKIQLEKMKRAEFEKAELQELLHQSQKMDAIGQLSGGIAHDFNNMLAAISGYAELIKLRFASDNETLEKYASGIYNAAQNAAELTSKLLTFARKGMLETLPVDLNILIKNVTNIFIHTEDKRIVFEVKSEAYNSMVMGDAAQLQNSLLNLVLNARDAMQEGGIVTISTQSIYLDDSFINDHSCGVEQGEYILMCVQDTGMGIDRATLSRVFEPFFTTKEQGKGTGLGLSMVFGTVKAHGGHVEIVSTVGVGTKVLVYLPVTHMSSPESDVDTVITKGSGFVLMIDDERAVRDVTTEMICDLGYQIKTCADGIEGIAYYKEHLQKISFVILDLMMPKMSGSDCLRELKRINPSVKVIIASGYAGKDDVRSLVESGTSTFLQKPFTRKKLSDAAALITSPPAPLHGNAEGIPQQRKL
jgi:two-component system cell cycle sensor histidine kinase/response regulator CckA